MTLILIRIRILDSIDILHIISCTKDRILSLQNNSFIVRCKKRDIRTMDLSVPRCASVNIIAAR